MDDFQESGMKMFAFTSKHHEGFSMFDTKTRVKKPRQLDRPRRPAHRVLRPGLLHHGDAVSPRHCEGACDAAHKRDIKIDLYFSHPDWYDADFRPYVAHPLQIPSSATMDDRARLRISRSKGSAITPSSFPIPPTPK
jgi:alpha-L-fucosidase